ncbi:TetR/AcrR family transcriptional regulator [Dietzia cinnamea]|uniref:TetR/AcrR family transcriptional regulator n=1 Tax=Dietzia cinnamea TaxID=321318 RepID=UPI0021A43DE5|nr:TetR/AcrR family transcriptional regulator [Dietzia cinnamea]MCT1638375.1 TetR/AcrR family transcriptional regulator [Dietzia cinnamea]MCT1711420.1 TetR/AcrR family transcriptional regulator [Dietzia cinnamea]MCT2272974.1 TetR/AcrR family transcriptional regulator [Dietzia cinnamea]
MSTPTDPRRARSRGKLLDAAADLLVSGGAAAVTVEAVTRLSGVARTTLYRNFPSTDSLIAAAFRRLLPAPEPPPADLPLREQLLHLCASMTRLIQDAPLQQSMLGWLAMGRGASEDDEVGQLRRGVVDSYTAPLHAALSAAEADGTLVPGDRDLAVAQLAGPVVVARMIGLRPFTPTDVERLVDDFLRGRLADRT